MHLILNKLHNLFIESTLILHTLHDRCRYLCCLCSKDFVYIAVKAEIIYKNILDISVLNICDSNLLYKVGSFYLE